MEDLGFIEKLPNGAYKMSSTAMPQKGCQMDDVLTIQKWYQLSFLILKILDIEKDDSYWPRGLCQGTLLCQRPRLSA